MGLKSSYTFLAPIYDSIVESATQEMRISSLQRITATHPQHILINGIGTGLDIPYLPGHHRYVGTDITPAMLNRCEQRLKQQALNLELHVADAMQLPFENEQYDIVIMNLILAVVPEPERALQEACRVLKPGGKIFILDKFIRRGQLAITRKLLNYVIRHIATRTDVVFEDVLDHCPELKLIQDIDARFNGWFRLIDLEKIQ